MSRKLNDMVVVITGASAGIGKALAERLSARGAKLVLAARRVQRLEHLNREMSDRHLVLRADVAQREDCQMLVDRAIERFGRIDTLVCNAGYGLYRTLADTSPEEMRQIFATNLFGTSDCIAAALPHMLNQELRDGWRGQLMLVSSCVARRAIPYLGAYSATKAAQLSLAEALRVELRPQRIAVTSVHPIQTKTEFGVIARTMGGAHIAGSPVGQNVQLVIRKMTDAIVRPRAELWPYRPARWAFGLGTLLPRLGDWILSDYRRQVEARNRTLNEAESARLATRAVQSQS
jgi:short-subunit dehydrogenase